MLSLFWRESFTVSDPPHWPLVFLSNECVDEWVSYDETLVFLEKFGEGLGLLDFQGGVLDYVGDVGLCYGADPAQCLLQHQAIQGLQFGDVVHEHFCCCFS